MSRPAMRTIICAWNSNSSWFFSAQRFIVQPCSSLAGAVTTVGLQMLDCSAAHTHPIMSLAPLHLNNLSQLDRLTTLATPTNHLLTTIDTAPRNSAAAD